MYCTYLFNVTFGPWPTCLSGFHYSVEDVEEADSSKNSKAHSADVLEWAPWELLTQESKRVANIDLGILKGK